MSIPDVNVPDEAKKTGLGGIINVPVTVDAEGNVVEVREPAGPGAVCRQVTRADVVALRAAARDVARRTKFEPARTVNEPLSLAWVRVEFPSDQDSVQQPEPMSSTNAGPPASKETSRWGDPRESKGDRYTVKGDVNFSASDTPPAEYKGPVNTSNEPWPDGASGNVKTISGGVVNGKATALPRPPYPPAARAVRASGAVSVQVLLDTNGKVFTASAVSGHPLLRSAATVAACGAEFPPTLLSGQPVKVSGIITYNFVP